MDTEFYSISRHTPPPRGDVYRRLKDEEQEERRRRQASLDYVDRRRPALLIALKDECVRERCSFLEAILELGIPKTKAYESMKEHEALTKGETDEEATGQQAHQQDGAKPETPDQGER
jgi:hypothetical protein